MKHNKTNAINYKHDTSLLSKFTPIENKINLEKSALKVKWAKFVYIGKETKFITEIFNNSNPKISFTTQNTMGKLLKQNKNGYN